MGAFAALITPYEKIGGEAGVRALPVCMRHALDQTIEDAAFCEELYQPLWRVADPMRNVDEA
ncbi:MAG: hypothetical protein K6346_03905 [Halothiobacillaceae bacterium]